MSKGERDHIKAYHRGEKDHIKSLSPTKEKVLRAREHSRIPYIKGEREITSKLNHFYRGRKYLRERETPDVWCSRGEMPHVFLRGKDMFICAYLH